MADVRPFRAIRPRDDLAARVIAPPYDVLTDAECMELGRDPLHFVHVTRSEIDLPAGTDPHSPLAWNQARLNLDRMLASGVLVEDEDAKFHLYGQEMGDHVQVCLLGAASVAEYDDGRIVKHEFTRPDKEDDRARHMEVLDAQVGLVFLAYRPQDRLDSIIRDLSSSPPRWQAQTEDGVIHRFWSVPSGLSSAVESSCRELDKLYICDGHHRSAAASRVHARRQTEASSTFLAGLFPADQLVVMAYNRVVDDLNGHDASTFLAAVGRAFEVTPDGPAAPVVRGQISMFLAGRWSTLTPRPGFRGSDAVSRLDVSILQDHLLGPILGIDDPRRSTRIHFVGGIRGTDALVAAVEAGAAVAFSLAPTGLDQLFDVADSGEVMPPKSTWFEPKLREGVVSRRI